MQRRKFIRYIASMLSAALTDALICKPAWSAWRSDLFGSGDFRSKFALVSANHPIIDSQDISLTLPQIAEDGAVVPIIISSELDNIDTIYVWIEKNPTPLAASFQLSPSITTHITARIKMAESCNVIVLARQGEHWLRCQQWVQVMRGGCGTG
jgi:sulfur-oxidizing protein SoxY